jgi:hypothetical protein
VVVTASDWRQVTIDREPPHSPAPTAATRRAFYARRHG